MQVALMNNIVSILEAAIKSKTAIAVIYQGGSHPGALRTLYPVALKDGLLKARDLESGQSKSYKLDLIQLSDAENMDEEDSGFRHYHSLYDLLLLEQALILHSGLFVQADRFHIRLYNNEEESASVAPVLSIHYQKPAEKSSEKASGGSGNNRSGKSGPWICNGISYKDLQQAAEAFVTALRKHIETNPI